MALSAGKYEVVSRVETPECSLRLIRLGPGRQVEQHFHEHSTQVYFVLSGEVEITVGREQRRLQAQQSARVPPFMP
ncbi:MAG: cupin domain-containing protein, partial [Chloroflexi bacterium]|nr:cupin domain-containing protein [Chloroflexota bacterium]